MRVRYDPPKARIHYLQKGGELPGVQYGSGFFGNLMSGMRRSVLPALKAIGKAALPMAKQAVMAGLATDGSVKDRLRAAGQSAVTKKNLIGLAKGCHDGETLLGAKKSHNFLPHLLEYVKEWLGDPGEQRGQKR